MPPEIGRQLLDARVPPGGLLAERGEHDGVEITAEPPAQARIRDAGGRPLGLLFQHRELDLVQRGAGRPVDTSDAR